MALTRRNFLELAAATTALSAVGIGAARAQDVDTLRMGIAANGPASLGSEPDDAGIG